jgi:hypothetical protein
MKYRACTGVVALESGDAPPWLIAEYKYKEYATVVNLSKAKVSAIIRFLETAPEINIISLSKLIDGGAAMLALIRRNQRSVRLGAVVKRPLVSTILRE